MNDKSGEGWMIIIREKGKMKPQYVKRDSQALDDYILFNFNCLPLILFHKYYLQINFSHDL